MHDGAEFGIEVGGVADLRAEHVEILVVHDPDVPGVELRQVLDLDLADQDVAVEIDTFRCNTGRV